MSPARQGKVNAMMFDGASREEAESRVTPDPPERAATPPRMRLDAYPAAEYDWAPRTFDGAP